MRMCEIGERVGEMSEMKELALCVIALRMIKEGALEICRSAVNGPYVERLCMYHVQYDLAKEKLEARVKELSAHESEGEADEC